MSNSISLESGSRRHFLSAATAAVAAGSLSRLARASTGIAESPQPKDGNSAAIRLLQVHVPEARLADLRRRIKATRWPPRETVSDASQGVQLFTMQNVARHWASVYDWSKLQERLNALPQFVTEIDGLDIHFIHMRSQEAEALPIIITHGWPGSIIEQLKIIDPLVNPLGHGGSSADAFDVVIPSLPGYGFSSQPTEVGWDPARIARAWIVLMERLGYSRYVAQGGDWGNAVTEQMALLSPDGLVAIHTNMPATVPEDVADALKYGRPAPVVFTEDEQRAFDQLDYFYKHGLGYALEMANRPQSLYAIEDSPIGLAAWMFDHDASSQRMIARVFSGASEGLSPDDLLDNVTLYWLSGTAVSSARLYWENKLNFFQPKGVQIPVAVSVFPDEIYAAPRSWTEMAYPKLLRYSRLAKGGHFAAWEQPVLFVQEVRASFQSFR